jgi:hypothetical protein
MPAAWQFQSHKEKALPQKGTKAQEYLLIVRRPVTFSVSRTP